MAPQTVQLGPMDPKMLLWLDKQEKRRALLAQFSATLEVADTFAKLNLLYKSLEILLKIFRLFYQQDIINAPQETTCGAFSVKVDMLQFESTTRRCGRAVECTGFENRHTERYQRFKSSHLRNKFMNKNNFEELVDKDKYQVFLFTSPCSFPLSFAVHPWFVINQKGKISRYGFNHIKNVGEKSWGHLALNSLPPFSGLGIFFPFYSNNRFNAKLVGMIENNENGTAKEMADFIENSKNAYPLLNTYHLLGPNSNTYAQWVLNHFPEFKFKLPWNAIGKKYRT